MEAAWPLIQMGLCYTTAAEFAYKKLGWYWYAGEVVTDVPEGALWTYVSRKLNRYCWELRERGTGRVLESEGYVFVNRMDAVDAAEAHYLETHGGCDE